MRQKHLNTSSNRTERKCSNGSLVQFFKCKTTLTLTDRFYFKVQINDSRYICNNSNAFKNNYNRKKYILSEIVIAPTELRYLFTYIF